MGVTTAARAARPRREQLLEAAAELFAARGYHAVGIDDIGAAAGITGPGVYRHFASKQALLEELVDRVMTRMLDGARETTATVADPAAALQALVDRHVALAVDERALLGVYYREQRSLSDDARRAQRRLQRAYEQQWAGAVAPLRDDLTTQEVAVVVIASLAMLNATAVSDVAVPAERLRTLLRRAAMTTLLSR